MLDGPLQFIPDQEYTAYRVALPAVVSLISAYPNPFNPSTLIRFELSQKILTKVSIYNLTGQRVALLQNRVLETGIHELEWNSVGFSSGVYFARIETDANTAHHKLMLLKKDCDPANTVGRVPFIMFKAALLLLFSLTAIADIIRVPQDYDSLQTAVSLAMNGDTVLVSQGTYQQRFTIPSGEITLCSNYIFSHDTTDIVNTVLNGSYEGSIITVEMLEADELTIQGFTLQNGFGIEIGNEVHGGGIDFQEVGNVHLKNLVFLDNLAERSGAAFSYRRSNGLSAVRRFFLESIHLYNNIGNSPSDNCKAELYFCKSIYARNLSARGNGGVDDSQFEFRGDDSLVVRDVLLTELINGNAAFMSIAFGYLDVRNVTIANSEYYGRGSLGVFGSTIGTTIVRNINFVQNQYFEDPSGVFDMYSVFRLGGNGDYVDADSILFSNNNVEAGHTILNCISPGELRNLHVLGNHIGSATMSDFRSDYAIGIDLRSINLRDVWIMDNVFEMPQNEIPGRYMSGGHYLKYTVGDVDTLSLVNLNFVGNLFLDPDDSPLEQVIADIQSGVPVNPNQGRLLDMTFYTIPDFLLVDSCNFIDNLQPVIVPEVADDFGMGWRIGSSVRIFKLPVEGAEGTFIFRNCLMSNCDDGGLFLGVGTHQTIENVQIIDTDRSGMLVRSWDSPTSEFHLRNIHIENVDEQLAYMSYPYSSSAQAALVLTVLEEPILIQNLNIVDCDQTTLIRLHSNTTGHVFNSTLQSNNTYDHLFSPSYQSADFTYSLTQEPVGGVGNIWSVDPLFDVDSGIPFLSPVSPCIDAGDPDPALNDIEDTDNPGFALWPSQGELRNDIGYTGGPNAGTLEQFVHISPPHLDDRQLPTTAVLLASYPNPFNSTTTVHLQLSKDGLVTVSVYNLLGQLTRILLQEELLAGEHTIQFDATDLSSGVYFIELRSRETVMYTKVLLIK